jgi:hypothetical protein
MYARKTAVVFQVRVRFAGVKQRKHWLDGALWLKRRRPVLPWGPPSGGPDFDSR